MGERELNLTFAASGDLDQSPLGPAEKETQPGGSANVRLGTSDTRRRVIPAPGRRRRATTPAPLLGLTPLELHQATAPPVAGSKRPCCGDASAPDDALPNRNLLARSRDHLRLLDPMPTDSLLYCMSPAGYVHGRAY